MMHGSSAPLRLAVFASGGGSNFGAMLKAIGAGRLDAEPVLLITDRPGISAIEKAERAEVPVAVLPPSGFASEGAFAEALLEVLAQHGADFVALAGYLKKIPAEVVQAYRHRMLNIHPALLPAFGGKGFYGQRIHEAVLEHGCRVTGVTVHLVDAEYDTGPIVLQEPVPVKQDDTPRSLAARVLQVEHHLYPKALQLFAEDRVILEDRRVLIREA
ncbi:MAG: phosphoribosylglycinamide formyltransferase [Rhodothermaceae bacterium]|nr:phosphoribosylglycinamide formyltransferase [Rhodothermaceae bacterium]